MVEGRGLIRPLSMSETVTEVTPTGGGSGTSHLPN